MHQARPASPGLRTRATDADSCACAAQGRLYVFDSFICFYSNVFGVERRKIIALQNVTQIVKARTALVVPNAIEVVTLDGKRDFFTSFITHDRAYRLMLSAWAAKSPFAEVFFAQRAAAEAEAEAAKVAAAEAKAAAEREKAEKAAADKAAREAAARESAARDAAAREAAAAAAAAANAANAANPAPPVAPAVAAAAASIGASIVDALDFLDFRRAASGGDASSGGVKSGGDAEDESDEDPLDAADAADDEDGLSLGAAASVSPPPAARGRTAMARRATAPAELPSAPAAAAAALPLSPVAAASPSPARPPAEEPAASASPQAERPRGPHHARMFSDASDGVPEALRALPRRTAVPRRLSAADLLELDALDTPAEPPPPVPAWPKAMKQVLEVDIDASLEALVEAVWSDAAAAEGAFARSVYASRQETEVHITPWGAARGGGFQRDVTFRAPVKGASRSFGPKSTYCHQTQQCRRYGPPAFVLRSSQVMNDIPYGDYFRVEMRWDLRAAGPGRVNVRVGVEVPFSKSTFLRGTIESTTLSETTEMARDWVAAMKRQVAAVAEAAAEEEAAAARSPSPGAATPGGEASRGDGGSGLRRNQSLERTVTPRPAALLTPPPGTPRSVASRRDLDDDGAFGDAKAAGGVAALALAPAWLLALCAAALLLLAFMAGSARAGGAGGAHLSAAALQEQRAALLLAAAHVQPHAAWAPPRPATTAAAVEADWLAAMPTEPPAWETCVMFALASLASLASSRAFCLRRQARCCAARGGCAV